VLKRLLHLVLVGCLAVLVGHAHGQPMITAASLTDQHVSQAIAAITEELHARRHPDRFWEPEKTPSGESVRQQGGYTALVMLAMLYGGQTYQDPRLRDAVDYLAQSDMQGTYAVTLRSSVWAKLPPKFRDQLQKDAQWLLDGFSHTCGGWDYVQEPNSKRKDNSIRMELHGRGAGHGFDDCGRACDAFHYARAIACRGSREDQQRGQTGARQGHGK